MIYTTFEACIHQDIEVHFPPTVQLPSLKVLTTRFEPLDYLPKHNETCHRFYTFRNPEVEISRYRTCCSWSPLPLCFIEFMGFFLDRNLLTDRLQGFIDELGPETCLIRAPESYKFCS